MKLRIYIAGPISGGDLYSNIRQAEDAFFRLLKAGFAPFCPHWSCYSNGPTVSSNGSIYAIATAFGGGGCNHTEWLGVDLPWVSVSDALLRLPGQSKGADMEEALARELGIPVYTNIDVVIKELANV